jgi:hypothetical protein
MSIHLDSMSRRFGGKARYATYQGFGRKREGDTNLQDSQGVLVILLVTTLLQGLASSFYDIGREFPLWQIVLPLASTMHWPGETDKLLVTTPIQGLLEALPENTEVVYRRRSRDGSSVSISI